MANFIAKATANKGGLHETLGIAKKKKIPQYLIEQEAQKGGKGGKQAQLAMTLAKLRK